MRIRFALSLILLVGGPGAFGDTIFISPASQNVTVGQTFTLDINIDNIPNVYDYQFSLSFNPHVLSAQSITEGALFANTHDSFFTPGTINNTTGAITVTSDTLIGSVPGVAGPGTLAIAQFTALATGMSSIDFSPLADLLLQDSNLNTLSVTPVSGEVIVTAVPEPGTLSLLAFPLLLILLGALLRLTMNSCRIPTAL